VSENPYEPPLTPPESEPSTLLLFLGKLFPNLSKAVVGSVDRMSELEARHVADKQVRCGQDSQRVEAGLKVSQDHAADYRLTAESQPVAPLKLLPKAVFRHSQPVRGDDIGAVYLWVDEAGLPAALGTVFAYSSGEPGVGGA
jgi:hypothetical protein